MMEWPIKNSKTGGPSTTGTALEVWCAAVEASKNEALLKKFKSVAKKDWRYGYRPLVHELGCYMAACPAEEALAMAQAGLGKLQTVMVVNAEEQADKKNITAREAFFGEGSENIPALETVTIKGEASGSSKSSLQLASPHQRNLEGVAKNIPLNNGQAKAQLEAWAKYGCLEHSVVDSAMKVLNSAENDNGQSLVSNKIFVLLGATSAMGPIQTLMRLGASNDLHVLGIARRGKKLEKLVGQWKENCGDKAILQVPQKEGEEAPGGDMMLDGPALAKWIVDACPNDKQIVLCPLAYLDGEANVRVGVAMDLICDYVSEKRPDTALSYILSPGMSHVITEGAALDAQIRYKELSLWQTAIRMVTPWLKPSKVWEESHYVLDGLSSVQGPNYALTKTFQIWRCMVEAHKGRTVSAVYGPPTRTDSMVSHSRVAVALEGMQHLAPIVAFDIDPANSLLTILMLYGVNFAKSPKAKDTHPTQYFVENSVHGGCWRCPYTMDSIGPISYLMGTTSSQWCPHDSIALL